MAGYNGELSWGIQPLDSDTSNLAGAFWETRDNYLKSVNDPLRYQIQWFNGSSLTEEVEPSAANFTGLPSSTTVGNGDIVNVVFKVYTTTDEAALFPTAWNLIGTIKKSRDMINTQRIGSFGNSSTYQPPKGHRFTIDVSQLVADELSYSLCPIKKGTWQSNYFGGMNGGLTMQDNVLSHNTADGTPVSRYNVSLNGTFRTLRIEASFEIINGDGEIVSADGVLNSTNITVINSVNQFEKDILYYNNTFSIADSSDVTYQFLTRCPNAVINGLIDFKKPVRIDEQAEWLQFYIRSNYYNSINDSGTSTVGATAIKIVTYDSGGIENTFYLRDFEDNMITTVDSNNKTRPSQNQNQMFVQNISPDYIKNSGKVWAKDNSRVTFPYWSAYTSNTITSNTIYYEAYLVKIGMGVSYVEKRVTKVYKYTIDREDEKIPYGFVRFHWLNSLGGIDSYTAKRDVVEGLTISRDVIERKSGDRTWYQNDKGGNGSGGFNDVQPYQYHSDTMRGGDIYKGGREVSNVNAERVKSVYTEPLNKSVAKWLEEIMLSPNVWIEMDTDATEMGNLRNSYLRPSTKEYIPVIITNSDVETVNQAEGLVKFNIEYTLSHKVITQRN